MGKFLVVSGSALKKVGDKYFGYGPYIKELNIWARHVDKLVIVAPLSTSDVSEIDREIEHSEMEFFGFPEFSVLNLKEILQTISILPGLLYQLVVEMKKADHIHLRCPSNVGLIGSLVQIAFPGKKKSVKYAANWDWKSRQPWSSRVQQRILRNTIFSRNITVLVYGEWPDRNKNILPFFTASYTEKDKYPPIEPRILTSEKPIELIYVGGLVKGKQPLLSAAVVNLLTEWGIDVRLTYYGEGPERRAIEDFVRQHKLENRIVLKGNRTSDDVKDAFKKSHFLVFMSRSEGWPKVVAECMFWGCYPITTSVSMVPQMIGNNERGSLIDADPGKVAAEIKCLATNPMVYKERCAAAINWSQQFTMEKFENEIVQII